MYISQLIFTFGTRCWYCLHFTDLRKWRSKYFPILCKLLGKWVGVKTRYRTQFYLLVQASGLPLSPGISFSGGCLPPLKYTMDWKNEPNSESDYVVAINFLWGSAGESEKGRKRWTHLQHLKGFRRYLIHLHRKSFFF